MPRFVAKLKTVSDLGQVLDTDESDTYEDTVQLAQDMIQEYDPSVETFEEEGDLNFTWVRGYDEDETESNAYVTIEECDDLDLDELNHFFFNDDEFEQEFYEEEDYI